MLQNFGSPYSAMQEWKVRVNKDKQRNTVSTIDDTYHKYSTTYVSE